MGVKIINITGIETNPSWTGPRVNADPEKPFSLQDDNIKELVNNLIEKYEHKSKPQKP